MEDTRMDILIEGRDFGLKGGKPGFYDEKGNWYPIDVKKFPKSELEKLTSDYVKRRGQTQVEKDLESLKTKPKPEPAKPAQSTPASQPSQTPPRRESPAQQPPAGKPTPPAAPAPTPVTPKSSSVADYMKAAAAARKSGDPSEMAKVRDMGMQIWRKSNPKLAAAADEKARIRGTQQTDNPLMKDMRSRLPMNSPSVQSPEVSKLGAGNRSLVNNPNAFKAETPKPTTPVTPKASDISVSKDTQVNKSAETLAKTPLPTKPNLYGTTMGAGPTYKGGPVPPQINKDKVKKEAYDIVLDYLLSEGHAETLSEAHYVMMQMDAEYIQNIVIQERAWWDPAGLFMSKREKEVEKAKSTPTGARGSYNPDTGRTYNPTAKDQARATGVIAPKGGIVGTMEPGKLQTWQRYAPGSDAFRRQNIDRYVTVRGREQIQLDDLKNRAMADKAKRDAAVAAAFDKKYADVYKNTKTEREGLGPRPSAPVKPAAAPRITSKPSATAPAAPKPQPPTIQSKNVTSTGTSYERRTPTSAELAAARAAGGGEAGIKAAVDVAKTNKVAATSPTPDLKPEAPKKRESLAAQVKELQTMRKAAEERNK